MVTLEQSINERKFHYGECVLIIGPRGGKKRYVKRWRANRACILWEREPERFSLPIKRGRNIYYHLHNENAHRFHLADECKPTEVARCPTLTRST